MAEWQFSETEFEAIPVAPSSTGPSSSEELVLLLMFLIIMCWI